MTAEELAPPPVEVWPCNWPAVQAFVRLLTQWQMGPSGPVGLRYESIGPVLSAMRLPTDDLTLLDDIRTMEHAALQKMARDREDRRK